MTRLEALALAVAREHQAFEPFSDACLTLNPGMLKSHSVNRVDIVNNDGLRVFSCYQAGHRALVDNIRMKCEGRTLEHARVAAKTINGKLLPTSPLVELCKTYRSINPRSVVEFLQDVLDDRAINERTPIAFFVET